MASTLKKKPEVPLIFLSYGTDELKCKGLVESARRHGIHVSIIGLKSQKWRGWAGRLADLTRALIRIKRRFSNNIVVCFVDGYDVLFVDNPASIYKKFMSFGKPFVISAERFLAPDNNVVMQKAYAKTARGGNARFQYVNAGTFIGTMGAVLHYLRWCASYHGYKVPSADGEVHSECNDQRCLTTYYLNHLHRCQLDHNQVIFSCMAGCPISQLELKQRRKYVINKATDQQTSILHFNGQSGKQQVKVMNALLVKPST